MQATDLLCFINWILFVMVINVIQFKIEMECDWTIVIGTLTGIPKIYKLYISLVLDSPKLSGEII